MGSRDEVILRSRLRENKYRLGFVRQGVSKRRNKRLSSCPQVSQQERPRDVPMRCTAVDESAGVVERRSRRGVLGEYGQSERSFGAGL